MRRVLVALSLVVLMLPAGADRAPAAAEDVCVTRGMTGAAYAPGINCRRATVNGYEREYIVYVPLNLTRKAGGVEVVLAFHGSGGSGLGFLAGSGLTEKADDKGFILVFPSALRYYELKSEGPETLFNTWADDAEAAENVDLGIRPPDYPNDQHWPADDLAFTDAAIDDVVDLLDADAGRVFATGFSNGGVFAMRLAVDWTDRIAAVASFGGNLRTSGPIVTDPIPVLYSVGTIADGVVLTLDAEELVAHPGLSVQLATMTSRFGLRADVYRAREQRTETRIDFTEPAGLTPASIFELQVLDGVTHQFPDPRNNPNGFSAADEAWKFFQKYAEK